MLRVSEESFINHNFAILGLVDHYKCNLVISSSRIRMISVLAELLFGQKQRKQDGGFRNQTEMRPDGTVQEWTEISEPRPTLRKVFLNCNFSPAWNICFIKARYYNCPISKNSICSDINLKESKRTSLIYEIYLQCHPRLMGNDNYLSPTRPSLISFSGPFFSLNYPHLCACHHNCRPI